jgi:uncharacterized tellurite resistance protein B-like protein
MSYSDLFSNEFKQRNIGHFASTVYMALADGKISEQEKVFLDRLATNLEISVSEYEEILKNPRQFNLNPPHLQADRLERLYDLVRIVDADKQLGDVQEKLLMKFGLALGFSQEKVEYIITKALALVGEKISLDDFIIEMGR